jgi:hypothetical protein
VARKDGEKFDCATWLHRTKELPKEGFKTEVLPYRQRDGALGDYLFPALQSQLSIVEQALETTALMVACVDIIVDSLVRAGVSSSQPLRST